ncbi:Transcriptional regulator, XRE family [uncultured Desulfobacterium sp.]|uniref:Transcriptional regulator, XRE family n=1 Tax=uncultured Desulfobacterium sp. TaxID=201089 RepID=A0A445N3X3_9BACT|nr:Transcriptional regulator, XRE family [uncultured Desulfobacterium sp.]
MTKRTPSQFGLPPELVDTVSKLGNHIRVARKRREMTLDDLASRMFVTRKTLSRLENGDPGVSLAVLASALWALGFEKDLLEIVHPEKDNLGMYLEQRRLPKRVRRSKTGDDLDF